MAKIRVTTYRFVKPSLLSEREFLSYKQMCNSGISFEMVPKITFWSQFPAIKWLLIASVISIPFADAFKPMAFIAGISIFGLFASATPLFYSYDSFKDFLRERNNYFENLKNTISQSNSYQDFCRKASRL